MITLTNDEGRLHVAFMGQYFGYPDCCVEWFFENRWIRINPLTPKQESVHGFHGFIPCPVCAEKVTSKTIQKLIKNRICETRYPEDGL